MLGIWEDSVPQFGTLPLAQAKQFWKQKVHGANEKAQYALMKGLVFLFLGAEDFMFFLYCSHHVPMGFPKASPSSQVVPQSSLPWIQTRKAAIGEHICFYVATWGLKRYLMFQKIGDGPVNMAPSPPPRKK
jgi:hypothetical protein